VADQKTTQPDDIGPAPDGDVPESISEQATSDDRPAVPIIQLPGDEELQAELDATKAEVLRAKADLENYRKRVQRDFEQERRFAAMPLLRDLLPVVDNVGRAIEAAERSDDATGLLEGFKLVAQQIATIFAQHGCQPIPSDGEEFDPNLHEAISQMPCADQPPGMIVQVTQAGYQLNDRVVRPSQVIISSGPPETGTDAAADEGAE
jgi:molecular chaperone GrpE